jgi:hypothetical protein
MDWSDLSHDRDHRRALVNMAINTRVLQSVRIFLSSYVTRCFSRRAQLHGLC